MDEIKAAITGDLGITPAEERDRATDAGDWDALADADMKLYPDAMRQKYPKAR